MRNFVDLINLFTPNDTKNHDYLYLYRQQPLFGMKYKQGIFFGGNYLFFESDGEKNCELRETDNVQGQMHEHIFAPNKGYCVYYSSNKFATRGINFYEHLIV